MSMENKPKIFCPRCRDWVPHLYKTYNSKGYDSILSFRHLVKTNVCCHCGMWSVSAEPAYNAPAYVSVVRRYDG